MKKLICLFLLFLLLLTLVGCSDKYDEWQNVSISAVGTFKVPKDWIVTQKEDIVYVTDKSLDNNGYKIYLVGTLWDEGNDVNYTEQHKLFRNAELIKNIENANYSNSAAYLINEYKTNEKIEEKYVVHLYSTKKIIDLIAWDNLIDKDTIIKIAKSYVME